MRKLILSTLALATLATPIAAAAQRGELQEDRREIRREFRDLQEARQYGDRDDIREERRELQDARREYRQDLNDRRGYGYDTNRRDERFDGRRDDRRGYYYDERRGYGYNNDRREFRRYQGANYYYPRGYSYRVWNTGAYLPRAYWNDRYYIGRPAAFGLPLAYRGTRWVRVGPDALLIRARNGAIVRVVRGLYY